MTNVLDVTDESIVGLPQAALVWNDAGEPCSKEFGDIYFPGEKGLEAARHIFLAPNNLPEAWKNRRSYAIGEVGFGTGLNFFAVAQAWREFQPENASLHFLSCEAFPLPISDIEGACAKWAEIQWILDELKEKYPPAVKGFHRIVFPQHRIFLTLLFGDARQLLSEVDAQIDAWFFDGFAPSKNEELWSNELFFEVARLSRRGTTFGTFSSAGHVKRALQSVGFVVEKFKGFEQKRESLCGKFDTAVPRQESCLPQSVTVIGGGLAGTSLAYHLNLRGISCTIIEREKDIALKASGNKSGVLLPYFSSRPNPMSQFYLSSFLYSLQHLVHFYRLHALDSWNQCGVLQLPATERLKTLLDSFPHLKIPRILGNVLATQGKLQEMGLLQDSRAFEYPLGGCLRPQELCRAQMEAFDVGNTLKMSSQALHIQWNGSAWAVQVSGGETLLSEALIIANAHEAKNFLPTSWIPISPVRGQIAELTPQRSTQTLKTILCYDGYLLPETEGSHTLGATFSHHDPVSEPREEDNDFMLRKLSQWCTGHNFSSESIQSNRVAFRTSTFDRMPFVGSVPNVSVAENDLLQAPPLPGLYVSTGFGSRGLISSSLAGELVASELTGEPSPLGRSLRRAIHPRRFIERCVKKRQTQRLRG